MHPLYEEAMQVAERLREARLEVIDRTVEAAQAEYDLAVVQARIERGLIKKVGDEKRLGPTVDSRERVFTLARDADQEFLAKLQQHNESKLKLDRAKVEVSALHDKLNIMLAALQKEIGD